MTKKTILAICGSTRISSTNLNLIKAVSDLLPTNFKLEILEGLIEIPHFNPDLDNENPPASVIAFRNRLMSADGILICTPEYAMGVPGTLKNAIDWTVSSCEFSHKPVALITAPSLGEKGHASLLGTLKIIESNITDETQLVISYAKTKISKDFKITDGDTLKAVTLVVNALRSLIEANNSNKIQF